MPIELWSRQTWEEKSSSNNPASQAISAALVSVYDSPTIQSRFDALYKLINECQSIIMDRYEKNDRLKQSAIELHSLATRFAMNIVDAHDEKELHAKYHLREKYKTKDPDYMPWITPITRPSLERQAIKIKKVKPEEKKVKANPTHFELVNKCVRYIESSFFHNDLTLILNEWNENASVRKVLDKLRQSKINFTLNKELSYQLEKLNPQQEETVFAAAMRIIADKNKIKQKKEIKSQPTSIERKQYLKQAMLQMGRNSLQERYSYNTNIEMKSVHYLLNSTEREPYRIFSANGILKKIEPNYTKLYISIVRPSMEVNVNPGKYFLVQKGYDDKQCRYNWELHKVIGNKEGIYSLDNVETLRIDITDNIELNNILKEKSYSEIKKSDTEKINDLVSEQIAKADGSFSLKLNNYYGSDMIVVSPKGDMFAGEQKTFQFHHSSFLGGGATIFAGMIYAGGSIGSLSGNSGHYRPDIQKHVQTLAFFRKKGLIHSEMKHVLWGDHTSREGKSLPLRNFNISNELRDQLINEINKYISSRAEIKNDQIILDTDGSPKLLSKLGYNKALTKAKVSLALKLKKDISETNDYTALIEMLVRYRSMHDALKNEYNNTSTKDNFSLCFKNLTAILEKFHDSHKTQRFFSDKQERKINADSKPLKVSKKR